MCVKIKHCFLASEQWSLCEFQESLPLITSTHPCMSQEQREINGTKKAQTMLQLIMMSILLYNRLLYKYLHFAIVLN